MEKNRFISQRTHTRVMYQPLRTSCRLVCLTPMSPMTQSIVVGDTGITYDPNREMSPTVILPEVRVQDPDGILAGGACNYRLGECLWKVDGKPISEVWVPGTDYETDNVDKSPSRGMLTLKKNIAAHEKHTISFVGRFLDTRTGVTYTVTSNEEVISTTDKGEDMTSCFVDKTSVVYDPLYDGVLLYEYKKSHGMQVTGLREDYVDEKSYEQYVNVVLAIGTKSAEALPAGVEMQLYEHTNSGARAVIAGSTDNPEVTSISYPRIGLDMRMVDKKDYEVRFVRGGITIARDYFTVRTDLTMPDTGQPRRSADVTPGQLMYNNTVMLSLSDRMIPYPELYYTIQWYTQARMMADEVWQDAPRKAWQRGKTISAPVSELGIGVTSNDSYFDLYFEVDPQGAMSILTLDGAVLTDNDGNELIV